MLNTELGEFCSLDQESILGYLRNLLKLNRIKPVLVYEHMLK